MSERYSKRNQSDPNFDLDSYIREKSEEHDSTPPKHEKRGSEGSFLRNTMVMATLIVVTLLYFNDWSPKQVVGNIFGIEQFQEGYTEPLNEPELATTIPSQAELEERRRAAEARADEIRATVEQRIEDRRAMREAERQAMIESMEAESQEQVAVLESELANLSESDEMYELQRFALETAMEALGNLENLEGLEDLENLENLDNLGELGDLGQAAVFRALAELDQPIIRIQSDEFGMTFGEYRDAIGTSSEASEEEIADMLELYFAKVPTEFIKEQREKNPDINYEQILETYKENN
jgi:hypothetical protein